MKLATLIHTFDLAIARASSRRAGMRVVTLSLVVSGALLLQGCLAGAWVALVSVSSMTSSHVTFEPFEQSWVAPQDPAIDAVQHSTVTSVAVLPIEGDPEMRARLATVLQQETTLRVESPVALAAGGPESDPRSATADDADRSALAKALTRDLHVDTILVSRVAGSPAHPSDWGRNAAGSRRLYLYLVNRDGHLLWKDELPFTLGPGATPQVEASVQVALAHHVRQHVKALRLDKLGYLPKKSS